MSWFRMLRAGAILAVVAGSVACGSSSTTDTTPSAPTTTETFVGTLLQGTTDYGVNNGNHFTVKAAGNITATITKLAPLNTITVGLGLGVYDAASSTCTLQLFNDATKVNVVLSASVGVGGELCVGIYDVGNVGTDPVSYEISITHT